MGLWFSGTQRFWASGRKEIFLFYLKMGKGKGRGEKDVHRFSSSDATGKVKDPGFQVL